MIKYFDVKFRLESGETRWMLYVLQAIHPNQFPTKQELENKASELGLLNPELKIVEQIGKSVYNELLEQYK